MFVHITGKKVLLCFDVDMKWMLLNLLLFAVLQIETGKKKRIYDFLFCFVEISFNSYFWSKVWLYMVFALCWWDVIRQWKGWGTYKDLGFRGVKFKEEKVHQNRVWLNRVY